MDAQYLKENVGDVLADGLAAVILHNPPDKVQYLGMWLLNYVEKQQKMIEAEKTAAAIAAHDAKQEQYALQQAQAREAQLKSQKDMEALKEQSISQALADATQFEGVLEGFCARLKALTNASSVYVAERTTPSLLKYVAATDDNKFMLENSLDKSGNNVTWDLFRDAKRASSDDGDDGADGGGGDAAPEPDEDNPDWTDAEREAHAVAKREREQKAALERRSVFVGNVLMGENAQRVKFFRMPQTGSYHALRVSYQALLNEATLEAAPKLRTEIAERNAKAQEAAEAAELAKVQAVLNPWAKPKKPEGEAGEGGDGDEDEDARDHKRAPPPKARGGKKNSKVKEEEEDEEDAKAKRKKSGISAVEAGEVEDDAAAYQSALQKATEADAALDTAEAEDPDLEEKEKFQRKQARDSARAALVSAAEAMRKRLAEARAREQALSDEQKEARAKERQSEVDKKNLEQMLRKVPKKLTEYVVAMDTLAQNRRFSAAELARIEANTALLQTALIRIDRRLFLDELKRRDELTAYSKQHEKSAEDVAAEIEERRSKWLKEHKDQKDAKQSPEEAAFRYRKDVVYSLRSAIAEFRSYNVFRGPLPVLQCLFYLLDYKQAQVADKDNNADWKKMRMLFTDSLFNAIVAYDPTVEQVRTKANAYAKIKNLSKLLQGVTYDALKAQNLPLAELFAYIQDALKLKKRARDERKKAEEARKAAEAKAAAAEAKAKAKADAKAAKAATTAAVAEDGDDGPADDDAADD